MLEIKKKLFGYDPTIVDTMVNELNEKVFSLRQELFDAEKKATSAAEKNKAAPEERAELIETINELKKCKEALQIKELQLTEFREREQQLEQDKSARIDPASPNYAIIEKIYARAFESSKLITDDAKAAVLEIVNSVFSDVSAELQRAQDMYYSIHEYKTSIETLVNQIREKLEFIGSDLSAFGSNVPQIIEFNGALQEAKELISAKVSDTVAEFEKDVTNITSTEPKKETPIATAPMAEQTPAIEASVNEANEPVAAAPAEKQIPAAAPMAEQTPAIEASVNEANEPVAAASIAQVPMPPMVPTLEEAIKGPSETGGADISDSVLMNDNLADSHFSLDAVKLDSVSDVEDANTKKFKEQQLEGAKASFDEDIAKNADKSLLKMRENIQKQFAEEQGKEKASALNETVEQPIFAAQKPSEQQKSEDAEVEDAMGKSQIKPKISIEHILKKYSNLDK